MAYLNLVFYHAIPTQRKQIKIIILVSKQNKQSFDLPELQSQPDNRVRTRIQNSNFKTHTFNYSTVHVVLGRDVADNT